MAGTTLEMYSQNYTWNITIWIALPLSFHSPKLQVLFTTLQPPLLSLSSHFNSASSEWTQPNPKSLPYPHFPHSPWLCFVFLAKPRTNWGGILTHILSAVQGFPFPSAKAKSWVNPTICPHCGYWELLMEIMLLCKKFKTVTKAIWECGQAL